jgi:thiamine biosynthesis lipoprotein
MPTIHFDRPAMATRFEMWLVGEDPEHLAAVGEAAWEEVLRVERMLSRFDPAAEIARVNREAANEPVLVDYELFAVLEDCRQWAEETEGYFEVCAASGFPFSQAVRLDARARTVELLDPRVELDLGGCGKGYALDAAARVLERYEVAHALLHGGTSSVLVRGTREDGTPWPVGVRDPFAVEDRELRQLPLRDCGLSTSAVFVPQGETSDLVDPTTGRPLTQPVACVVATATAVEAEVLSTALLAMGKSRAREYLERKAYLDPQHVLWIERTEEGVTLDELFPR